MDTDETVLLIIVSMAPREDVRGPVRPSPSGGAKSPGFHSRDGFKMECLEVSVQEVTMRLGEGGGKEGSCAGRNLIDMATLGENGKCGRS